MHYMLFNTVNQLAGLQSLWTTVRTNWLGPIFFAAVAVFAIMFIKDRAWTKLIAFIGIAAVVGVLLFAGEAFFGERGSLKGVAEGGAEKISSFGAVAPGVSLTDGSPVQGISIR